VLTKTILQDNKTCLQLAVWRNGGFGSSEKMCNFAARVARQNYREPATAAKPPPR